MAFPERRDEAVQHLESALRLQPDYAEGENNLGLCLLEADLCGAAIPHFESAVRLQPGMIQAHNNLALCLTRTGQYGSAISHLETALRINPSYPEAHFNLAVTLGKMPGREQDAIAQYEAGLRLIPGAQTPGAAEAHRSAGKLLMALGRTKEATAHFEAAQQMQPDDQTFQILNRLRQ